MKGNEEKGYDSRYTCLNLCLSSVMLVSLFAGLFDILENFMFYQR